MIEKIKDSIRNIRDGEQKHTDFENVYEVEEKIELESYPDREAIVVDGSTIAVDKDEVEEGDLVHAVRGRVWKYEKVREPVDDSNLFSVGDSLYQEEKDGYDFAEIARIGKNIRNKYTKED